MPRLLLLRHGKSAWPEGVADPDRPLAARGRTASPRMGAYLADEGLLPDLALVSPARRTRETWDLVRPHLGDTPARFEPRLYEAPAQRLLTVIREIGPDIDAVLMVGHNPGFEDLLRLLAGHGDRHAYARAVKKYPTAALAVLDFPVPTWREIAARSGRLDRFVTPKSLGLAADD